MMLATNMKIWGVVTALTIGTACLAETPRDEPLRSGSAIPADADARRKAAKLAGLVRFVDASCPSLKPNYSRFRELLHSLNVNIAELEAGQLLIESAEYTNKYRENILTNCRNAEAKFGIEGQIVPNLFEAN